MAWFKVDDQLAFNAKIVAAGNEAMGLWVRAGSWSAAQLTDGFVPIHMANAMANGMAKECGADALVMAGLWDEVDGGFQFHDWSEFQPDAETEKAKRKKRSLAGQKGAAARWGSKSDSKPHGKSHGKPMANECDWDAPTRPDPTRPINTSSGFAEAHPDAAELIEWFNAQVTQNGFKKPSDTKANRDAARLLLGRDGISTERAREVAVWALADEFWRTNIRSFSKLRDKFETLEAQMQRPQRGSGPATFDQQRIQANNDLFMQIAESTAGGEIWNGDSLNRQITQ
ncbi:hypothetical protein BSP239C_03211 [Brevibacterium sp. 239c]|uniref:hypothetical protein n=1 Tax=Brevibacterium sp. 239c TaxID=1965356 RepID=UPI000C527B42|nr:hypothetical protein [Brevibacterium sp. 239c]SMY01305.1 hypothetical protein BSP239C_03211 [Brevibacterium sp. 239c]